MTKLALPARPRCVHSLGSARPFVRSLGWMLLGLGCTSGPPTTYDEVVAEFVAAWEAARVLCDQQAVCGGDPVGPCVTAYRPPEEIVSGVSVAHLDIRAIWRCRDSAEAYGACLAPLDCAGLAAPEAHCASERWRYEIDCAALHTAFEFIDGGGPPPIGATGGSPAVGGGGTGGDGPGGGPASGGRGPSVQADLAVALCERAEACTGIRWSGEQAAACERETAQLFGPLIPDPAGTDACVAGVACSQLQMDAAGFIAGCVGLDPGQTSCVDARAIHACTGSGVCQDLPCRDVCSSQGRITLGCAASATGTGDVCQCG